MSGGHCTSVRQVTSEASRFAVFPCLRITLPSAISLTVSSWKTWRALRAAA